MSPRRSANWWYQRRLKTSWQWVSDRNLRAIRSRTAYPNASRKPCICVQSKKTRHLKIHTLCVHRLTDLSRPDVLHDVHVIHVTANGDRLHDVTANSCSENFTIFTWNGTFPTTQCKKTSMSALWPSVTSPSVWRVSLRSNKRIVSLSTLREIWQSFGSSLRSRGPTYETAGRTGCKTRPSRGRTESKMCKDNTLLDSRDEHVLWFCLSLRRGITKRALHDQDFCSILHDHLFWQKKKSTFLWSWIWAVASRKTGRNT